MLNKEELELNAKLQQKKNALRKELAEIGIVKKDKKNTGQNYTYLSEAGYKELFTKLFSKHKLELKFNVDDVELLESKNNARLVKTTFELIDCETGYSEKTNMISEGVDFSDKATYKAYTGALKYFLANTFAVATGDEVENDDIKGKNTKSQSKQNGNKLITAENKKALLDEVPEEVVNTQLQLLNLDSVDELTVNQARKIIKDYKAVKTND